MKTKNYFLSIFFAISSVASFAANYDVSVYTDGLATDANTLRWAITQANAADGNTISFSGTPADITLTSALPALTKSMTINATGSTQITIIAYVNAANTLSILTTAGGKTTVLNYLTLKDANGASGTTPFAPYVANGGALNVGGTTTCNNCVFQGNKAATGGAVRAYANFTCNNCTFTSNSSTNADNASAIFSSAAITIALNGCVFQDNNSVNSVVYLNKDNTATLNISNCIFKNNITTSWGGGAVRAQAATTITNTVISGNTAQRGAGICIGAVGTPNFPTLTMTGCTVSGNSASSTGGGLFTQSTSSGANRTGDVNITNCTFSGNSTSVAATNGAGINVSGATTLPIVTLTNCTVTGNYNCATSNSPFAGGINRGGGTLRLNYCIVAGNNVSNRNGSTEINMSGNNVFLGSTMGRNLIGENPTFGEAGAVTTANVALTNTTILTLNTILNPTLADNGGATALPGAEGYVKTHALVAAGSAINPVTTGLDIPALRTALTLPLTDQLGVSRDLTPDMGAYEAYEAILAPDAPVITLITPGDLSLSVDFTAPLIDGGSAIVNYEYSTDGGTSFTPCSPMQIVSPIIISGLTNETPYNVQIKAVNIIGAGAATASTVGTPSEPTGINSAYNSIISAYQSGLNVVVDLSNISGNQTVSIFDVQGRNVITSQLVGGRKLSIANNLPQGIYIVKVSNGEKSNIVKLFIK